MSNLFRLGDGQHFCCLCFLDHFKENKAGKFVEDAISLPQKVRKLSFTFLILHVNRPEFLWYKLLNLLMPLDYETQRGKLAGSIADNPLLIYRVSQQQRLKPGK